MPGTPLSKLKKETDHEASVEVMHEPNDLERQPVKEERPLLQGHSGSPFGTTYASINHL